MERHEREKEHADFVKKIKYVNDLTFCYYVELYYLRNTCKEGKLLSDNTLFYDKKYKVYSYRELQKLLYDEQRSKEQLEGQLKTYLANKTQCKILEAELEITKTKLKQAEEAAKETPPLLISLQAEMAMMKKQHLNAIREVNPSSYLI